MMAGKLVYSKAKVNFWIDIITKHLKWVTSFSKEPVDTTKWQNLPFMSADYEEE